VATWNFLFIIRFFLLNYVRTFVLFNPFIYNQSKQHITIIVEKEKVQVRSPYKSDPEPLKCLAPQEWLHAQKAPSHWSDPKPPKADGCRKFDEMVF
jgi:hypothetical protein